MTALFDMRTARIEQDVNPSLFVWFGLLAVGTVMIGSASVAISGSLFIKHLIFLSLSLTLFVCVIAIPLDVWRKGHKLALTLALLVTLAVLIPGVGHEVNGAQRWIRIAGFSVQASEVVKPLLLIYLAGYLERFGHLLGDRTLNMLKPIALVGLVCFLLLLEPDFGTVVVLAATTGGLLFVAGARLRHFLLLVLVAGVSFALLVLSAPYRMERMASFTDPWATAYGSGYQLTQALIAFGRGELTGLGLGEGIQKLDYLPEAHNDFIFAVIAEELGVLGVFGVMALFAVLIYLILRQGHHLLLLGQRFAGYLCYGVGFLFALQFAINLGVNTGVLPTKGLTLPFVSFGGNSLIVCCMLYALVVRADLEARSADRRGVGRSRRA